MNNNNILTLNEKKKTEASLSKIKKQGFQESDLHNTKSETIRNLQFKIKKPYKSEGKKTETNRSYLIFMNPTLEKKSIT